MESVKRVLRQVLLPAAIGVGLSVGVFLPAAIGSEPRNAEPNPLKFVVQELFDLKRDGANQFTYSPASGELFISHPDDDKTLHQWNVAEKKHLHAYMAPPNTVRWSATAVSHDGKWLIATTYPDNGTKCQVYFIDPRTYQTRFTTEYENGQGHSIHFDRTGKFARVRMSYEPGEPFVYDYDGNRHADFDPKDFEPAHRDRLWDVSNSKAGPPPGLFFRDSSEKVHLLAKDPFLDDYALNDSGRYIGAATRDRRVRIWRVSDLKEVFNQEFGEYPVRLIYDDKRDRFLVVDGVDGDRRLRSIEIGAANKE